jgi:SAM-dependent methyltransferase
MATHLPGRRVLDLGIGPGVSGVEMARAAPAIRIVGLDRSSAMLRRAKLHAAAAGVNLALVCADASRLPFADGSYDAVTGHSVLYLLPDRDEALREIRRVLRPRGRIAFLEPGGAGGIDRLRATWRSYRDGVRFGTSMLLWGIVSGLHGRFTPEAFVAQLERHGFAGATVRPAFDGLAVLATAHRA